MSRAVWWVITGILSVQVGAAVSKHLFGLASPTTMVWLRLLTSTVVLLAMARPRVRGRSRTDWAVVLGFGSALAVMNWAIYQSFARIPLGIAVTLEFAGPLTLAVVGSRRPRDLLWALLAGIGVVVLGFRGSGVTLVGVLFALLAGACWAAYILLSKSTGARWPGLDGLAIASCVGAVGLAPFAIADSLPRHTLASPEVWSYGALVGLLSSVVPYSFELAALRTLAAKTFGILMSLEPAAAALVALVVLREHLDLQQWLAILAVIVASIGATRTAPPQVEPVPD